ncbi:MAG: hypothetical protein A2Y80_00475 [Deltaproteobacteria bacterium RBG_13_58_19]|nr:MAG: hypothetical protein A2Y80_00475 [Deltaproteobacteria bacterium RBG_13_58_19]
MSRFAGKLVHGFLWLLLLLVVPGCMGAMMLPMLLGGMMGTESSPGSSSPHQADADAAAAKANYAKSYNDYRARIEAINQERQGQKLAPQRILSFQEWLDTLPLSSQQKQALLSPSS